MIKEISQSDFEKKIQNKDGDFSTRIFNFPLNLSEYIKSDSSIDFELNFSKCVFKQDVSFAKITITENVNFSRSQVEKTIDFFNTRFLSNFEARRSEFFQKVNFNLARFHSDADFSMSVFYGAAHFKKSRFHKNLFIGKAVFHKKIDFSYAHFSNDYYTSFASINKIGNTTSDYIHPPYFIFRNIFFPKKTIFNDVDMSKTTFQDSIIDNTIFKDCAFPKKENRNAFYAEISQKENIALDNGLEKLITKEINTIILPNDKIVEDLNIGDILEITNNDKTLQEEFFIVTRFDSDSSEELQQFLQQSNLKKAYSGFNEILCQDCNDSYESKNGVVGFRLKKFHRGKHWEVLEDNYRQMKKSLEESRDWQGAGDFYRGEMYAKIQLLKSRKEQFWYRNMLRFYGFVSAFGESTRRILAIMMVTFFIGSINLFFFKPELSFFEIMAKNIGFFLPIFGNNADTIKSLQLQPWQDVVVQLEIVWFYLLWLIMAIAIRRRFKR